MSDSTASRPGKYDDIIRNYFYQNPGRINYSWTRMAKETGVKDYRTLQRWVEKNLDDTTIYRMKNGEKVDLSKLETPISFSDSQTEDYGSIEVPEGKIHTWEEYCVKYHIPIDQVTSAKFVNHQGQAAWNCVVDFTRISESHLNDYFDRLKKAVAIDVKPIEILQSATDSDKIAYHMYYSDKHVGAETRANSMYPNLWNAQEFRNRLINSLKDVKHSAKYFGRFDKILISDLGDSVDGWNGKTTRNSNHSLPQNLTNKETFDVYVSTMIEWIETLISLGLANEYEFVCTSNDNHGGDFSYIVNRAVEVWLNVKYPEIKTTVGTQFIEEYHYGNHAFMLCHGKDEEDLRNGLPLNLNEKVEGWINEYIINYKLLDKWCHFIKGDLHQEGLNFGKRFRYRNVLSLYGSSAWMMTNFGNGKPGMSNELVWRDRNKVMPSLVELN